MRLRITLAFSFYPFLIHFFYFHITRSPIKLLTRFLSVLYCVEVTIFMYKTTPAKVSILYFHLFYLSCLLSFGVVLRSLRRWVFFLLVRMQVDSGFGRVGFGFRGFKASILLPGKKK
jgi:hypothetical protein